MKFKDKYTISKEFEDIFSFENEKEELEHDAKMLMLQFFNEMENCKEENSNWKKKDLAKALGKSPSFISQLYSGDKIPSLQLLAKIQKALNISFKISARDESKNYNERTDKMNFQNIQNDPSGYWVWIKKQPDYSKTNNLQELENLSEKITAA